MLKASMSGHSLRGSVCVDGCRRNGLLQTRTVAGCGSASSRSRRYVAACADAGILARRTSTVSRLSATTATILPVSPPPWDAGSFSFANMQWGGGGGGGSAAVAHAAAAILRWPRRLRGGVPGTGPGSVRPLRTGTETQCDCRRSRAHCALWTDVPGADVCHEGRTFHARARG